MKDKKIKRRQFLYAASIIAAIPVVNYTYKFISDDPLKLPDQLRLFCETEELIHIGQIYIKRNPQENSKEIIKKLILSESLLNGYNKLDKNFIRNFVSKKIYEDFSTSNMVVLNGWVISKTEARQCALLAIS